jgi:hypothetical protein
MKKNGLRLLCFVLIATMLAIYLGKVFSARQMDCLNAEGTTITVRGIYAEPKDTLDVLSIGASTSRAMLMPLTLWQTCGITSYSLATPYQSARASYYLLLDALRNQSPKVVILNPSFLFASSNSSAKNEYLRMTLAAMRPSLIKLRMALDFSRTEDDLTLQSLLFPLLHFHGNYLEKADVEDFLLKGYFSKHPLKGTSVYFIRYEGELPGGYLEQAQEAVGYDPDELSYVEKMLEVCKEKGIQVLFVAPPKIGWTQQHHDLSAQFCEQNGYLFLDFNEPDVLIQTGFDSATDYDDPGAHANIWGQEKLSSYLSSFLRDQYSLVDHRGDAQYSEWNEMVLPD